MSPNGELAAFTRRAEGTRTSYVWTLPLDPATGLPTGPARRASMSPGSSPAISPDGKSIAFAADSDRKRLTVIPVNGGLERDLVHGPGGDFSDVVWAPDGSQLYFDCATPGEPSHDAVKRIAATGGTPVTIDDNDVDLDGISVDGSHLIVEENAWPWDGPVAVDTSGHRIPATAIDSAYIALGDLLSATRALATDRIKPTALMSLTIGGTAREIAPTSMNITRIWWSPDGTRFAGISHTGDVAGFFVTRGDGSNQRIIKLPQPIVVNGLVWSPDGKSILVAGRREGLGEALIVSATTGAVQVAPMSGRSTSSLHWMRDSKHLLYFSGAAADSDDVHAVRETAVGGPDRLVRTLPWRAWQQSTVIADTSVIAVRDSGGYLISLNTGNVKALYQYDGGQPTVSPRGDLIVVRPPERDATGGARRTAEVMTPTGAHVATVRFPGIIGFGVLNRFFFTPDERSIIGTGRDAAGKCCVIYQGFLDGTPTRILGQAPNTGAPALALSPDGKTLLFTVGTSWTTTFTSVDVSSVMHGPSHE